MKNKSEFVSWFMLPYIPKILEEFRRISNIFNTKLAFTSLNKLNNLIKVQKHILQIKKRKNVVYKIACKSCKLHMLDRQEENLKLDCLNIEIIS